MHIFENINAIINTNQQRLQSSCITPTWDGEASRGIWVLGVLLSFIQNVPRSSGPNGEGFCPRRHHRHRPLQLPRHHHLHRWRAPRHPQRQGHGPRVLVLHRGRGRQGRVRRQRHPSPLPHRQERDFLPQHRRAGVAGLHPGHHRHRLAWRWARLEVASDPFFPLAGLRDLLRLLWH